MPQNNLGFNPAIQNGTPKPLNLDGDGNLLVVLADPVPVDPASNSLNITAATVVKASAGTVLAVTIVDDGSAGGFVHDCAATVDADATNAIIALPTGASATFTVTFPCATGIVVAPGTGQIIAIAYE